MPAPVNRFKAALLGGERSIGLWMGLCDPYAAEIVGRSGFDWLLIDSEHAPNDLGTIARQMQVLAPLGPAPIVRLPMQEGWAIKQMLDLGVQTLLFPMVESAAQARALARAMRYPPDGGRGMGGALARATNFGREADYAGTANDEMCLLVQVESRAGLDALDEILAVPEVDGVFIGPADLSADMGYPGRADAPEMQAVISETLGRIAEGGKAPGILQFDPSAIERSLADGARFVAVGADVTLLAQTLSHLASRWTAAIR